MSEQTCPKYEKCPIYTGESFMLKGSSQIYKELYCLAGPERYKTCKRYIVSEKTGIPVPKNIMPNTELSVEEIIKKIKK
jgi:hypothetical protein